MTARRVLRPLPLSALLAAKAESERLDCGADAALCACILARSAGFRSGKTVLRRFSAEQILALTEEYLRLCRTREDALRAGLALLAGSPAARLRWRIAQLLGLPVRGMTMGTLRVCAEQLLLEPEGAIVEAVNPAFDEACFRRRKEGA